MDPRQFGKQRKSHCVTFGHVTAMIFLRMSLEIEYPTASTPDPRLLGNNKTPIGLLGKLKVVAIQASGLRLGNLET